MAFHWIPPPPGALKINVHGTHTVIPLPNGNNTGIGAIYRDANGQFKLMTTGVIPRLSRMGNKLWAIYFAMRRTFKEGYHNVIIETDNLDAFKAIKSFNMGASASVYHIVNQIDLLLKNNS